MKLEFQCNEDYAKITKDGEVIVQVSRDDDSYTAVIEVLKALAPLLQPQIELNLGGY